MKQVKHKYPAIDLARLLNEWTDREWKALLDKCVATGDVEKLKSTLYGICRGMDELAKVHLNDEKMCAAFAHLQRSIEVAMKRILRKKYPSLLDAQKGRHINIKEVDDRRLRKELDNKRKRDLEFSEFLRDARF